MGCTLEETSGEVPQTHTLVSGKAALAHASWQFLQYDSPPLSETCDLETPPKKQQQQQQQQKSRNITKSVVDRGFEVFQVGKCPPNNPLSHVLEKDRNTHTG